MFLLFLYTCILFIILHILHSNFFLFLICTSHFAQGCNTNWLKLNRTDSSHDTVECPGSHLPRGEAPVTSSWGGCWHSPPQAKRLYTHIEAEGILSSLSAQAHCMLNNSCNWSRWVFFHKPEPLLICRDSAGGWGQWLRGHSDVCSYWSSWEEHQAVSFSHTTI